LLQGARHINPAKGKAKKATLTPAKASIGHGSDD